MIPRWIIAAICPLAGLFLGACVTTNYTGSDNTADQGSRLERQVIYHLDKAYYTDAPDCVAVLPSGETMGSQLATTVEDSLARHLTMKVSRVIGPGERTRLERELAIDTSNADGRRRFTQLSGCRAYLRWRTLEANENYAFVFSSRSFGLELEMTRGSDEAILWSVSHVATRWDGSLPLSPLAIPFAVFEATRFHNDADILPSMVDDVVRRMFVSLPHLR